MDIDQHTFVFTKKNGELRTMQCVLASDLPENAFPPRNQVKEVKAKPKPEHLITVWDVEAKGFRTIDKNAVQAHETTKVSLDNERRSEWGLQVVGGSN